MFTILMKDVDGRRSYRYFKTWENAERAMLRDIKAVKSLTSVCMQESVDKFNADKGFYEREETLVTKQGMRFHYALLDGYFEDEQKQIKL